MRETLYLLCLTAFLFAGCKSHPLSDYRPLDLAGMSSSGMEQLKPLNTSDAEIAELVKLKQAGITDDTCVALIAAARAQHRNFSGTDSVINLVKARFAESQVLAFARADKLDLISGDAVMLRLIGLSDPTVQALIDRRLEGLPTLASAQISQLKNTGLSEKQILERINSGMTDEEAQKEIASRVAKRNHANTDFVRVRGRRR